MVPATVTALTASEEIDTASGPGLRPAHQAGRLAASNEDQSASAVVMCEGAWRRTRAITDENLTSIVAAWHATDKHYRRLDLIVPRCPRPPRQLRMFGAG
jgi:hypothetical protein